MKARLLFLDFDGVLHPNHCTAETFFCHLPLLNTVIESAGDTLKIVISSSWRHHHAYEDLLAWFPKAIAERMIGTTGEPYIGRHARYQEIQAYLSASRQWTDWRALDDSAWEFPTHCPELIHCNGAIGITEREISQLSTWATG